MQFPSRLALLSGLALLQFVSACQVNQTTETPNLSSEPEATAIPTVQPFQEALGYGAQASERTQTAQTVEDWTTVVDLWQKALNSLQSVPASEANYDQAQAKITSYTSNLQYAQERVSQAQAKALQAQQVSVGGGGLGDPLSFFIAKYGNPQNSSPPFQKFKCNPGKSVCEISVFESDNESRAYAVEITLTEKTPSRRLTKAAALNAIQYALPKDVQKVREWEHNEDTSVVLYSSRRMAEIFPSDQGNVIAIILHDTNQPNSVFAINLWSGDTP